MTEWIAVGRVGRSHGLDGSFVVEAASEEQDRFAPGGRIYVNREPALVVTSKLARQRPVIRLDRHVDRGSLLELPSSELPPLSDGEFYAFQLVGLTALEEGGRPLGRVDDVVPGIANDVLELDTGLALPLVEACVRGIDLEQGQIVIAPGFAGSE